MPISTKQIRSFKFILIVVLKGLAGYVLINGFLGKPTSEKPGCSASMSQELLQFSERVPSPYTNPGDWENFHIPSATSFKTWFNSETWKYDDPLLVEAVKEKYLIDAKDGPYKIESLKPIESLSDGQVQAVEGLLRNLTPGIFIECGANDGELLSNTLWLEKELGWSGLLVECDPYTFRKLLSRNRKAWHINACLSSSNYPQPIKFWRNPYFTEAGGLIRDPKWGAVVPVEAQSIPLFTILLAMNKTTIDFFSLDVEGNELEILKTVPFDRVIFKILTVEYTFIPEGREGLKTFMESKGYIMYKEVTKFDITTNDLIFIHPSLKNTLQ